MRHKFRIGACVTAALAIAAQAAPVMAQSANGVGTPFELAYWQSVGSSDDPALYEAYLQQYPQGTFAALARAKVAGLRRATTPPSPAAAAPSSPAPSPAAASPAAASPTPAVGPALAMAVPVTVPGSPPASAPVANAALGQMLADLARSQETPGSDAAVPHLATPASASPSPGSLPAVVAPVSPVSARYALPPHPQMLTVPELVLPASFCSAEDRNRFHDTIYRPALDAAKHNNEAAVAYLKQLQGVYDGYDLGKDTAAMNALAAEARAYQADAATAFSQQAALVREFDALMSVPLQPCAGAAK